MDMGTEKVVPGGEKPKYALYREMSLRPATGAWSACAVLLISSYGVHLSYLATPLTQCITPVRMEV